MPHRRSIISVVGNPINVPKIEDPSPEIVLKYQMQYLDGLQDVFNAYKDKYAKDRKGELTFIE